MKVIASTLDAEQAQNPDSGQEYGLFGLSDECAALLPPDAGLLPYHGIIDSHPYAITTVNGGWLIADAGANAIKFVDWKGKVKTVATLPPQAPRDGLGRGGLGERAAPVRGRREIRGRARPDRRRGGPRWPVRVTLPGGPEDPSLGARGGVYKVNPWNGKVKMIASGFAGATNLAVTPWGTIYVSELFGGQISKVVGNHGVPVVQLPEPAALEWAHGKLYAGIGAFSNGQIVTIKP